VSIVSGLLVGFVGGYALQRGGFCMNTAFRSIIFEKDKSLLNAWLLILVINIPVLLLLDQLGIIFPSRAPFRWQAGLIGGLAFGIGMVLAGGCVSGTYYRASKGMVGSIVALLGFALGGLVMSTGALAPVRAYLTRSAITIAGEEASLFNLPAAIFPAFFPTYGFRWVVAGIVLVPILIIVLRGRRPKYTIGWSWPVTGLVLAAVAISAWLFSSLEGRDYGLSFVQPTNAVSRWLTTGNGSGMNWSTWFLLGIVPGAFVAAWRGNDLSFRVPDARRTMMNLSGGVLMGLGATLAGGCNVGHGITGLSVLSIGSLYATATTIGGVFIATWLIYRRSNSTQQRGAV